MQDDREKNLNLGLYILWSFQYNTVPNFEGNIAYYSDF